MFIEKEDVIPISIHYRKVGHTYLCYNDEDYEKLADKDAETYKHVNIKMAVTDWGIYNDLQNGAIETDEEGERRFNNKKYKEARLLRLIKDWDVKDKDDKVIKPTPERIQSLAPSVAETILDEYDKNTFLSEEEEKN